MQNIKLVNETEHYKMLINDLTALHPSTGQLKFPLFLSVDSVIFSSSNFSAFPLNFYNYKNVNILILIHSNLY